MGSELERSQEDVRGPAGRRLSWTPRRQEGALILLPRAYSACLFQRGTRSDIVPSAEYQCHMVWIKDMEAIFLRIYVEGRKKKKQSSDGR